MTQRRYLSSLQRGLAALSVLNQESRLSAAELAVRIKVPRTSAHRILHTLMMEGYVLHDPHSHCYSLAEKVLSLADGVRRESVIATLARPILRDLCKQVLAPVGLATLAGDDVVIQVSMDQEAPLALRRLPEGTSFPAIYPPSGHLLLAYADEAQRQKLIAGAARLNTTKRLYPAKVPSDADLDAVRRQGYALSLTHNPGSPEGVMAAPVLVDGALAATIHIRFDRSEMTADQAKAAYLERLQAAAAKIGEAVGGHAQGALA